MYCILNALVDIARMGEDESTFEIIQKISKDNQFLDGSAEEFGGQFTSYFNVFSYYNLPNGHKAGFDLGYHLLGGGTFLQKSTQDNLL